MARAVWCAADEHLGAVLSVPWKVEMMSSRHVEGSPSELLSDAARVVSPPVGGMSRRQLLTRSGALLASGLLASRLGLVGKAFADSDYHEHAVPTFSAWAAARQGNAYLGLAGTGEDPDIRELHVGKDGRVAEGRSLGVAMPDRFIALALHATGDRLLVGGADLYEVERLELDYRTDTVHPEDMDALPTDEAYPTGVELVSIFTFQPALYEVVGAAVRELPLSDYLSVAFGAVTGIASSAPGWLAVVVEGSDHIEQAYNDITRVAKSTDAGRTWSPSVVASELGEGHRSHLVAAHGRLFVSTVDGRGERGFFEESDGGDADWRPVAPHRRAGEVLAVVAHSTGEVEVLDALSNGTAQRFRHQVGRAGWDDAGPIEMGQDLLEVVSVSGGSGELIVIGESTAELFAL